MLRIHPFVMGHLIAAVVIGGAAGGFFDPQAAFVGALTLFGGALVSSFICQRWPGVEAPAWKLWPVAVFASPAMLAALGFMAADWACVVGIQRGWGCFVAALAIMVAGLCLLPPFGGLLWRGFKRWRARRA